MNFEQFNYDFILGFKIGRLEFMWDSVFDFVKKEFKKAKTEIEYLVFSENILIDDTSYISFSSSIINHYMKNNIESFYNILIGICLQRCLLIGASKDEENNIELEDLSFSTLNSINKEYIGDKINFFNYLKSLKDNGLTIYEISNKIYEYLNNVEKTEQPKRKFLFISYSTKNSEVAYKIRDIFVRENINVWMAPFDIESGSNYIEAVADAICKCAGLILILSKESQESKYVLKEISQGLTINKKIFPINIDHCTLNPKFEFLIGDIQITEIKDISANDHGFKKLLKNIHNFYI